MEDIKYPKVVCKVKKENEKVRMLCSVGGRYYYFEYHKGSNLVKVIEPRISESGVKLFGNIKYDPKASEMVNLDLGVLIKALDWYSKTKTYGYPHTPKEDRFGKPPYNPFDEFEYVDVWDNKNMVMVYRRPYGLGISALKSREEVQLEPMLQEQAKELKEYLEKMKET